MAERFVKMPVGMTGKPTPMAVYYVLAEHRNSKTGRCNVTDQRVADRLELSVSTVARARIKLSDAGWLDWMPESQRPPGEIVTGHVSGEMATGQRNVRLNQLRNIEPGQHGLLANARCLSEGIDVPALDGVAFVDPRRSQVDIVQAVGRAIRLAGDKTIGTIIIPVYLTSSDDPQTALETSEFKPIWDVVNALRAHDDDLAEQLDNIRINKGRTGQSGPQLPDQIVIDAPTTIGGEFIDAINTLIIEHSTSGWLNGYATLLNYLDREGHAQVPKSHVETVDGDDHNLGTWVNKRRGDYGRGKLSAERIDFLKAVPGWVWDPSEADFQANLVALRQFVDREGHAQVPQSHVETVDGDNHNLGAWVNKRRVEYGRGKLSA